MRYTDRVGFTDVDASTFMYGAFYYAMADRAFERWQRESGLSWKAVMDELAIGMPAIESRCRYVAPLRFDDEVVVAVGVGDLTPKGFTANFEITRADGVLAAYGYIRRRFMDMATSTGVAHAPERLLEVMRRMERTSTARSFDVRETARLAARGASQRPSA